MLSITFFLTGFKKKSIIFLFPVLASTTADMPELFVLYGIARDIDYFAFESAMLD